MADVNKDVLHLLNKPRSSLSGHLPKDRDGLSRREFVKRICSDPKTTTKFVATRAASNYPMAISEFLVIYSGRKLQISIKHRNEVWIPKSTRVRRQRNTNQNRAAGNSKAGVQDLWEPTSDSTREIAISKASKKFAGKMTKCPHCSENLPNETFQAHVGACVRRTTEQADAVED